MAIDAVSVLNAIDTINGKLDVKSLINTDGNGGFEDIFKSYLNLLEETGAYQAEADQIQLDYAVGRTDDMLAVLLAQEKASSALNFTIQVTSKIIESYREIMRMQL